MSEILERAVEVFQLNSKAALAELVSEFDTLERKARCVYFIGLSVAEKDKTSEIAQMFEEVFVDLFQSISSCLQGQYRSAYQSLRSALELSVAVVYFADHPVEFNQWKNDTWDFQFSLIKDVLSDGYANALGVTKPPNLQPIKDLYRFLSQFVHGKFGYMTTAQEGPILHFDKKRSVEFIEEFNKTITVVFELFSYRFGSYFQDATNKYPFFQTIL